MNWTPDDLAFLRRWYGRIPHQSMAFYLGRSVSCIKSHADRLGIRATNRRHWTPAEDAVLLRDYPTVDTRLIAAQLDRSVFSVNNHATGLGLRKDPEYIRELGRKSQHHPAVKASRFQPGMVVWNKGTKGVMKGSHTSWKPGNQPHNTRSDGELGVRSCKGRPYIYQRVSLADWQPLHRIIWEEAHGPIPSDLILVFRDGDPSNIVIDNLELITRAENMHRNSIHAVPPEFRDVRKMLKKLTETVNQIENKRHEKHS